MFPIIDFNNLTKKTTKSTSVDSLSSTNSFGSQQQINSNKNFPAVKNQVYLNENPFDFSPARSARRKELGPFLSDKPTSERAAKQSNLIGFFFNCVDVN